jgi:hypothetical protein
VFIRSPSCSHAQGIRTTTIVAVELEPLLLVSANMSTKALLVLSLLALLPDYGSPTPILPWNTGSNGSMEHLSRRESSSVIITKMAAIGDSYSAGIGAGMLRSPIADFACRRYDHAYPVLVHQDDRLGDPSQRDFDFRSCSGAVIAEVMNNQVPELKGGQEIILLSAGRLYPCARRPISLTQYPRW